MNKTVQVFNEELDMTVLVPKKALPHYEERGWVSVETIEPEFPNPGLPRNRTNEQAFVYDDVDFDEEASDDQEE